MRTPEYSTTGGWLFRTVLFIMIFMIGHVYSQTYPVQVLAQYSPPTPIYFADFANASTLNGPLRVQMVLNDLQIANRQVRLQVSFNGNGISFKSRENVIGATPLFLEGGLPLVLDHTGLAPYFEFGNITGIPPNVYGSAIPDGAYQVCFEVYDVLTGKRLSNTACATMGVFQNSPPLLMLPENGSDMVERNPQNIMFQWTPRHINVGQVEYELSLVEIWDNALDPQAAFLASTPMFTVTTGATSYLYGPGDPMLLPNKRYAWRVQAKAKQGVEDIGMFLNQGYSQVFSFGYSEGCYLPNGIRHEVKGANQANVLWDDPSMDVPEFTVRYRAKGEGNEWFLNRTTANWTTLWDLKTGTTYEYQVHKKCIVAESGWSPIQQFTTNLQTEEEDLYQCGVSPSVEITNQDPLSNLSVGESFMAGDFQVIVNGVSGSNGYFTGTGQVRLPYLGNIKVAVSFTNILVNTDRQLAQGTVVTEFDPTMGNILDTGDVVDTVGELGEAIGDLWDELFSQKEELLEQLEEADGFEEQQGIISQINDLEVTIAQQIDNIPGKENLPQELQDELESLKQEGSIVSSSELTPQEIEAISNADAKRRERIKEIAAIAEDGLSNKNFKIDYCDSIVKFDKHNEIIKECNKLKLKYQKEDSIATKTVQMKLRVIPNDEAKDLFFPSKDSWQSVKYNEDWEVDFDSIPSGEYLAELKVNDTIYKHEFRMQKECTSGYCCEVCGRDLTVTLSRLQKIFPKNKDLTQTQATLFNDALKKGDFNTCKKQVHFFAQVSVETEQFKKFTEGGGYSLDGALSLHSNKAKVKEVFIRQSFFDENKHLDYFYIRALKNDTVNGTHIGLNFKTYKNGDDQLKIPTGKPNSRKAKKEETGVFTIPPYPSKDQRNIKVKKFFNVIYAKTNGNNGGDDGWTYRGQGAIHLTGKEIYEGASKEANKLFEGENFDWKSNPSDVSTKDKDRIYSAVAYFHYRYKKIKSYSDGVDRIQKQSTKQVSYDVNGGYNGLSDRQAEYTRISNVYLLNQCK